ncbi:MAG: hypothetical protein ABF855_10785 [Liquorilactobacillus satsumensis]|uniref:hypothetical protein n=1 Tax=Liquorilactobacillus satsumensis TaxID=259059 RepID=UPI0039E7F0A3
MTSNFIKETSVINALEDLSKKTFSTIPLGTMKETSVTDNILSEIQLRSKNADIIQYDDSYKETGKKNDNIKTRTCADYILIIKDKNGNIHKMAFQAKNGQKDNTNKIGNKYNAITHRIGNHGDYQIDAYDSFLKISGITGYYIFYNGNFDEIRNSNSQNKLRGESFWVLDEKTIKLKMGTGYKVLSLDDVVNEKGHLEFTKFLKENL